MARKVSANETGQKGNAALAGGDFSVFAIEEAEDNKVLRASMWFAVVFHALFLLINFPTLEGPPAAEPTAKVAHVYVTKRYRRPPPPPPEYIPPKRVKRMPMPDLTPREPELIPLESARAVIDLPPMDKDYFVIPDAPPAPPEPEGPLNVGGDVSRPVKISAPMPAYPEIARKARIQGTVIVQAIIDKRGDVTNVKVLKELRMGLTEAAVGAVKQWKFKPATLGGKPVDVYYNLTVTFSLQ